MMHGFVIWILFAFSWAQTPESSLPGEEEAKAHLDQKLVRIEQKMSNITSLHCAFTQKKKLAIFDQTLVIRGEIFMEHPESFAWHVHQPILYRMVIDGQRLQQWDEDTGKVQGISLKRNPAIQMAMAQMQAWFSGQYAALRKDYSITQVNSNTLRFVPRESTVVAGVIAQVEVCFLEDESYISSITISEKSGDQTALVFENTSLNKPVPSQAFDAKPSERK